jgi:hypothetical protein
MRRARSGPGFLLAAALALTACGRTEPYRFTGRGGTDAGAGDAGQPVVVGCTPGMIGLTRATPKVMFVLDRSTSMNSPFGATRASRWRSLSSALSRVLPPINGKMEVGALLFPQGIGSSCAAPAGANLIPALGNVPPLVSLLINTQPGGQTPTAQALQTAGIILVGERAAKGARAVVLATDGAPNCNSALDPSTCACADSSRRCNAATLCLDDVRTVNAVAGLAVLGIPTWVLGIQDSSTTAIGVLNAMARAGGRARPGATSYYAVTSESALDTALTDIRNQVGACVFLSSSVPSEGGRIDVQVDGVSVPADPVDGWAWTDLNNGELELSGAACDALLKRTAPVIEAVVECASADAGAPDGG